MKQDLQSTLTFPWGEELPEFGQRHRVGPGVYWLRLPLPFALDHINVWLLEDELNGQKGWTLVDTGVALDEQKAIWRQLFDSGVDGLPILRVLVTHMHPDHVGLAGWLCRHWQVPLWMSVTDYMMACVWVRRPTDEHSVGHVGPATASFFQRHGIADGTMLEEIRQRVNYYQGLLRPLAADYVRLMHADKIRIGGHVWEVIVGYGHAPDHVSLWCPEKNIFISGDMILPRISTNVSVHAYEPEANPLTLYLDSLARYAHIDKKA